MRGLYPLCLLMAAQFLMALSGRHPYDMTTWMMEVAPVWIAAVVLIATYWQFRLTNLAYTLIFVHACILMLGGHYSYARVPFGYWLQDLLHLSRNPYDRIGHFAQGFVPAIVGREILIRCTPLRSGGWLFFLVCCVCLAISACYEFVEWGAAVMGGAAATDFLGTQGDVWDTQWDMLMALVGSIAAQVLLSRIHDRRISAIRVEETP